MAAQICYDKGSKGDLSGNGALIAAGFFRGVC